MSIRTRLTMVIVFAFMLPLLLAVTSYIVYAQPFRTKTVNDVQKAPRWIIPPLQRILDAEDRDNIKDPGVILAVILDSEGFIYVNHTLRDVVLPKLNTRNIGIAELQRETRWSRLAISTFSYKGKAGMVFYNHGISVSLTEQGESLLNSILVGLFLVISATVIITSLFLISLRKHLNALAEVANKIKAGELNFSVPIPKDNELAPLFTSFDKMRVQLIEDNARKSRFLMAISHDLKTPLTSIKGYLEAFDDGMVESEEEKEKYLSIIRNKTEILEQRISELIDFARMETVSWQRKFVPLDLTVFLQEVSALFAAEADIHGKEYSSRIELEEGVMIIGDRQLLSRALENIFDNAVRYTDREVSIILSATLEKDRIRVSLADSGQGVRQEDVPLIFESFYRGSRARNEKGLGLGLSSVKSIIEAHGGSIDYRPSDMGGAQFDIFLPVQQEAVRKSCFKRRESGF